MKISITGPESTGKSWLAENLARHYSAKWVPEYARAYLEKLNKPYTFSDILKISKGQLAAENALHSSGHLLFCDTDILVTYIWCMVRYGKCHSWIKKTLFTNKYDLYLLCDIDLPWEFDKYREHPHMRKQLFDLYKSELDANKLNYVIINGTGKSRLENAIRAVESVLKCKNSGA